MTTQQPQPAGQPEALSAEQFLALAERATLGPWRIERLDEDTRNLGILAGGINAGAYVCLWGSNGQMPMRDNAALVVAARNAAPRLIRELLDKFAASEQQRAALEHERDAARRQVETAKALVETLIDGILGAPIHRLDAAGAWKNALYEQAKELHGVLSGRVVPVTDTEGQHE